MKDKTFLKLLLDIAMSVLYLMLMFSRRSGAFFHEAVGIGVVALFAAHLLLNRKMTRGLLASAKRGAARPPESCSSCRTSCSARACRSQSPRGF